MTRLVLDTSAYSHLRAGHVGVRDRLSRSGIVLVPTTVLGELEAGFLLGNRYRENLRILEEFLEEPFVEIISIEPATARHYGRIFAQLRRAGTPIPVNDIWIAATMAADAHLLTLDSDFARVQGLDHAILDPE